MYLYLTAYSLCFTTNPFNLPSFFKFTSLIYPAFCLLQPSSLHGMTPMDPSHTGLETFAPGQQREVQRMVIIHGGVSGAESISCKHGTYLLFINFCMTTFCPLPLMKTLQMRGCKSRWKDWCLQDNGECCHWFKYVCCLYCLTCSDQGTVFRSSMGLSLPAPKCRIAAHGNEKHRSSTTPWLH